MIGAMLTDGRHHGLISSSGRITLAGVFVTASIAIPLLTVAGVRLFSSRHLAPAGVSEPATSAPSRPAHRKQAQPTPALSREEIRSLCLKKAAAAKIPWDTISAVQDAPGVLFSLDAKESGLSLAACSDKPPYLIPVDY